MSCEHERYEPGDGYCPDCGCTDVCEIELTIIAADNTNLNKQCRLMREFLQSRASGRADGSTQWDVFLEFHPDYFTA